MVAYSEMVAYSLDSGILAVSVSSSSAGRIPMDGFLVSA
jgi:hypothetical protein